MTPSPTTEASKPFSWRRLAVSVLVGSVGGVIFAALALPLPWMLGSMTACLLVSLAGVTVTEIPRLGPFMRVVLGLMLGSAFTPELLDRAQELALSLAFIPPYIIVIAAIGVPYFRWSTGCSPTTAYFAAMPGGLHDMVIFGHAAGGDSRVISLAHGTRILIIVFVLPFLVEWTGQVDIGSRSQQGVGLNQVVVSDMLILALCGAVGWWAAVRLRLPGPSVIGPMLVSAAVHLSGLVAADLPRELVSLAQLVLGIGIGSRFAGVGARQVFTLIVQTLGLLLIMAGTTVAYAWLLSPWLGVEPMVVILAFAPGGLAESSLIALALHLDVAYVATHHLVRILLVVIGAPLLFRFIGRPTP